MMLGAFVVLGVVSATSVSVGSVTQRARAGFVSGVYFVSSNSLGSASPTVNTAQSTPSSSGSYSVGKGSSAYVWSPQFASATTLSAGSWAVDIWVSGSSSGSVTFSVYVTDSTGAVTATIANNVAINIGTTEAQVVNTFLGSSATIPAGGYLNLVITNPSSGHARTLTVYWGAAQASNLQAPLSVLTA